ncbi:barrier-to-autointegration factor-like [Pararge aegeria]|uniref:barrier-to-autointegration factor-like n=1 Tax=Pararge aegeria TaxID=116150 RepID=UPI0019D090BC|nr:barrier-to-autointegration factor-like [Pararge aegeria]
MEQNTTKKHRDFVSEPIGDKHVSELSGIGKVLGERMEKGGFKKASTVLGYYLVVREDHEEFQKWMKEKWGANSKQSTDCYNCLKDWTATHISA